MPPCVPLEGRAERRAAACRTRVREPTNLHLVGPGRSTGRRSGGIHAAVRRAANATFLVLLGLAALIGATGCGGPALRGNVFAAHGVRYRVGDLGDGWDRIDVGGQNDLAWRSGSAEAIVQVNSTCDPDSDVPLTALTNHLLIGFTDREVREQAVVPMDGREALRTHVVAKLDGVPRELLFVVLKKDDCVYDFALVAPTGAAYERTAPGFERFVAEFTTEVP